MRSLVTLRPFCLLLFVALIAWMSGGNGQGLDAAEKEADKAASVPLEVGDRVCLFLDDRFIATRSGLRHAWHQGRPRPEVALKESHPWERWLHAFGSAFHDPAAGVYRLYYESAISPSRTPGHSFTTYIGYAESKDGKAWTRPTLRVVEDLGSRENNIVFAFAENANAWIDPLDADPKGRLKMWLYGGRKGFGQTLYRSGDGLQWEPLGGGPSPAYADPSEAKFTDSNQMGYDPLAGRYMATIRTFPKYDVAESKDGRRRAIGVSVSKDLNKGWSPLVTVLKPDAEDDARVARMSKDPAAPDWAEMYLMPFFNYGNHYLGLVSLLDFIDGTDTRGGGDLQLAYSHDALTWKRPTGRPTAIAPSNAEGLFPTYAVCNAPLELGDELWLYYTEANGAHPLAPPAKAVSQIRAAVWRRDGFASLEASETGTLTSRLLQRKGDALILNFATRPGGSLRVAVLDRQGDPIQGFGLDDCTPLTGDSVSGVVSWKGQPNLAALQNQPLRLRVEMTRSSLFSFRFAKLP